MLFPSVPFPWSIVFRKNANVAGLPRQARPHSENVFRLWLPCVLAAALLSQARGQSDRAENLNGFGRAWLTTQHPRFVFAEIPGRYQEHAAQAYGFKALGNHLSAEYELWDTKWPELDLWYWPTPPAREPYVLAAMAVYRLKPLQQKLNSG